MPSFQSVSHVDHRMISPEMTNANGHDTSAIGSRNGRSAPGRRLRKTPSDSGAPSVACSTDALVDQSRPATRQERERQ